MASTLRLTVDTREVVRDLNAIRDHLADPIRDTIGHGAEMIATDARQFMRERPEGAWKGSSGDRYGHIKDYYSFRVNDLSASILTSHPAGAVWEWGGDIHPAGLKQTIHIPRTRPVGHAADADEEQITRDLGDSVSRLVREYGF